MDDIETLRKELEATKLAYEMTAQINQFKTGYLAKTAHELRSPLSSLMGLHQLILGDLCEDPQEEREFLQQGFEVAKKLVEIIDRIVTISKIDYGTIPLNLEKVSLNHVLNEVYQLTEFQAKNYSFKIDIKQPDLDGYIQVDSTRLIHGLTNLIDTAINLMSHGKILIASQLNELEKIAKIIIDIPCSIQQWQQEQTELETPDLTFISLQEWNHNLQLSPAMTLLLCKTLFNKMGGQLKILDISPSHDSETLTRLECLIPLVPLS
ncbi:MAG: HAMP domain-containing sensor histidine kinase [Crocosphaera sp.]|nr:HAMP domain-containing sensor histidine kinase [Crocosphaera sp.]